MYRGRAELALGWVSKTSPQGSIPWRPAYVVLAPRRANAGRQLKISGWKSREPRLFAATRGSGLRFHMPCGEGSILSAATETSGCSEVVSRVIRVHEIVGSIPTTPTYALTGMHGEASLPVGAPWKAVPRGWMSILHVDCAGFESLA